ncbi:hypothetical protein IEQ34_008541 [Dendrobium chrysotoxum]|uniref:Uncharacterized protein n=1 Tax=Dendrobium chrysotoxum TaxID=161865 RepID=A0AAV7GW78_DENCH|nr:hypothetical protein IEQ34_008541 [Dendrobium chrysotoxum]
MVRSVLREGEQRDEFREETRVAEVAADKKLGICISRTPPFLHTPPAPSMLLRRAPSRVPRFRTFFYERSG